jgi:hypothetical protein
VIFGKRFVVTPNSIYQLIDAWLIKNFIYYRIVLSRIVFGYVPHFRSPGPFRTMLVLEPRMLGHFMMVVMGQQYIF